MADTQVLTRDDRIALARQYHAAGAIIQGDWRRPGEDGREMVCALAAFGPEINSSDACPADLMPQWLAELVLAIDDNVAKDQVLWFSGGLIDRAARWQVLDDAAWKRIHTGLLIAGVKQAITAASAVHQANPPEYWPKVTAACDQVCTALETGVGLPEAKAAAYAAAYAARAAAYAAAYAAADAAADAAAYAAAYAAADAARAAAWKAFAETLFALIDVELDNAEAAHG